MTDLAIAVWAGLAYHDVARLPRSVWRVLAEEWDKARAEQDH